jgi:ligand-binding SRPBCC domain-containing protein
VPTITRSVLVRTPIQTIFDFHLDPRNLPLVQPPGLLIVGIEPPLKSEPGAEIRLTVRVLPLIYQHWLIQWVEIRPPEGTPQTATLTDNMLRGPFAVFCQERSLEQVGDATRMTDRVLFRPPLGPLGWLMLPLFYVQLKFMFAWRHRLTRQLLETPSRP